MNFAPHETAALQAQVQNLQIGYHDLRDDVRSVRGDMKSGFDNILSKIDTKTSINWVPIGILISVLVSIGGALIYPMRETASRQEATIEILREADRKQAQEFYYLKGQLSPILPTKDR